LISDFFGDFLMKNDKMVFWLSYLKMKIKA